MGNPDSEATGPNICAHAHSTATVVRVAVNLGRRGTKRVHRVAMSIESRPFDPNNALGLCPRRVEFDHLSLEVELVRANRASHRSSSTPRPNKGCGPNG